MTSQTDSFTITIITSVLNGGKFLTDSIKSVVNQTYPNIQYIIIDGGSTDDTVETIRKSEDKISYWISERDAGIYDAWNKALKMAKGEWITFIGADDLLISPEVISAIVPYLRQSEKEGRTYVYGKVQQVTSDLEVIETLGVEWDRCRDGFEKQMTLAHSCSFHHKSMFTRNGDFNASFRIAGDYEFLLREFRQNRDFAHFADVELSAMRTGGISGSLKSRLRMAKEMQYARRLNGFNSISIPIVWWLIRIRIFMLISAIFGTRSSAFFADFYRAIMGKKKRWSRK